MRDIGDILKKALHHQYGYPADHWEGDVPVFAKGTVPEGKYCVLTDDKRILFTVVNDGILVESVEAVKKKPADPPAPRETWWLECAERMGERDLPKSGPFTTEAAAEQAAAAALGSGRFAHVRILTDSKIKAGWEEEIARYYPKILYPGPSKK